LVFRTRHFPADLSTVVGFKTQHAAAAAATDTTGPDRQTERQTTSTPDFTDALAADDLSAAVD